ncbi:MAG: DUF2027 domain-containing protein [Muribaculaceae bacterium]|nr:DUF2027 domain-containing protein [Muribaculaceae bacterium]
MAKAGDRVRFLNSTGGGVITRIEGKTAYVEDEDGFESPILLKDIVVVLPAGLEISKVDAVKMFNQAAFDEGRKVPRPEKEKEAPEPSPSPLEKVEETIHGDVPEIILAFEPEDAKRLGVTKFAAVLVNDSNYFLHFTFLRRNENERAWNLVYEGTAAPNELIDMAVLTHQDLPDYEKIAFQCVAFKKDKTFSLLPPVNVTRKLDLTKFHKFHCFRPGRYFDNPVLEFPVVRSGEVVVQNEIDVKFLEESLANGRVDKGAAAELSKKYRTDLGKKDKKPRISESPFKKLPLIEVDLHIAELTDSTVGMEPKDMLEMQLSEVRKTMEAHKRRTGQKIVFIHGKGEGVLRKAVLDLLKKEYPKADLQDASFREYGFGATLVTI